MLKKASPPSPKSASRRGPESDEIDDCLADISRLLQAQMQVSVIVPVFNAAATLRSLSERIARVGLQSNLEFELVFVDDASTDGSLAILRDIAASSPGVV